MRKKILFVHHTIGMSGAPKSLSLLIENIDLEKFDPYVLLIWKGPVSDFLKDSKAQIVFQPGIFPFHGSTVSGMSLKIALVNIFGVIPTYFSTKRAIKKINPDLVHLNSTCLFAVAKAIKSMNRNIPVITHIREPIHKNVWGKILRFANNKYSDAYIAIDSYDLKLMNCPEKDSTVVFNYSELLETEEIKGVHEPGKSPVSFLFLGRIRESNGIYELVKMINDKFKDDMRCEFIIAGFSDNKSDYEKKVMNEIGTTKNIKTITFTRNIKELILSSDVIISPFSQAHFSRPIVEGASLGKPALVSDVEGQVELIVDGETGLKYSLDDSDDFFRKACTFIEDIENINVMGANAREFAIKNFDPERNSKRIYDFIENIYSIQN